MSAPLSHTPVLSRDTARKNCPQLKRASVSCPLGSWLRGFYCSLSSSQAPTRLADSTAWSSAHPRARPAGKAVADPPLPTSAGPIRALPHASAQLPQIPHTRSRGSFTTKTSLPQHTSPVTVHPAVLPGVPAPRPPARALQACPGPPSLPLHQPLPSRAHLKHHPLHNPLLPFSWGPTH